MVDDYLFIPLQSCWEKGYAELLFFGMLSWMWQYHNLLGVENQLHEKYGRLSRSERYFHQIITRKNFKQRFRNDWSFRRLHVWQELSPQKCRQMMQVSIYTDESHNVQLPTYTRCFAATNLPGKVTGRHMGALHDTGQNLSKCAIFRLFCGWQRREVASADSITKSIISMQRTETLLL